MPLPSVKRSTNYTLAVLVGMAVFFVSGCGMSVAATDTEIGAKVCGPNPAAAVVNITQPNDDSVVGQSMITLRGTVVSASQLLVEVDGDYNSTVAIASNQTTFDVDVTLTAGTHTVSVTANEICGGADGVDSIVVTYQPAVQPSSGEVVPTSVESSPGQGVVSSGAPVPDGAAVKPVEQIPFIGAAIGIVSDFATSIGLQSTVTNNNSTLVVGATRVGLTVAAVTSVVMASSLAPVAVHTVPGVADMFSLSSHRSMLYLEWVIRGIGALAMSLAYFL